MAVTRRNRAERAFHPFVVTVTSGDGSVRRALMRIMRAIAPLNITADETAMVELVMAETLNNVVEHAYPPGAVSGPIRIECTLCSHGLHMTVLDKGIAMPDGRAPIGAPQCVETELASLPEGGFGWFLIRTLTRGLHYERAAKENRLRFCIPVGVRKAG